VDRHQSNPKPINLISMTTHLVRICEETPSFELEFHSKKMLGDLYVELRKIDEAKAVYKHLIKIADNHQKYREQMLMFEQMGYCEHFLRRYDESIVWFKRQLELAWFEKDLEAETAAYGNMSREHFYKGDIDKANYYNDRMVRGKLENERSSLKTMSFHVVKNRRDAKNDK
jgi:tetratricopeptide (TPR) repeat protein